MTRQQIEDLWFQCNQDLHAYTAAVIAAQLAASQPAQEPAPVAPITGEQFYMARYGHEGAIWAANAHQHLWNEWADRLNAMVNAAPQGAGQ